MKQNIKNIYGIEMNDCKITGDIVVTDGTRLNISNSQKIGKKEEQAREYARLRYGNDGRETCNEIAKVQACTVGYIAGWDAAKQELLKEFRDHFCDAYCQYFGNDDYCRCCPIKDENCWLNGDDNNGTTNRSEKPNSSNESEV